MNGRKGRETGKILRRVISHFKIPLVIIGVCLSSVAVGAPALQIFESPFVNFDAGNIPGPIRLADMNGDGVDDLVVGNESSSTVTVLAGNGDGTFTSLFETAPIPRGPNDVATGDLNGDSRPDVAIVNWHSGQVWIYLSGSQDVLSPGILVDNQGDDFSVEVADMDSDGRMDLVVGHRNSSAVSILPGNGDGTFKAPMGVDTAANPALVAIGDLNSDGIMDLAAGCSSGYVTVRLGSGGGSFGIRTDLATGSPSAIAIQDVNRDGHPDLVVLAGSVISVFAGMGDGSLQPRRDSATATGGRSLSFGDFNGDGHLDAAVVATQGIVVNLGDGTGWFRSGMISTPTRLNPMDCVSSDFDRDGKCDLALTDGAVNDGAGGVSIHFGNGDGTFGWRREFAPQHGSSLITTADLNEDGALDLIYVTGGNALAVAFGVGGTFSNETQIFSRASISALGVADLNGDGHLDLVLPRQVDTVSVLLGRGDGSFEPQTDYEAGPYPPMDVAIDDFNGDGKVDLAVVHEGPYSFFCGCTQGSFVSLFPGKGDGTFGPQTPLLDVGGYSIASADFNRDGKKDLIVTIADGFAKVFLGRGDGTFDGGAPVQGSEFRSIVRTGDFNGDSNPDIAMTEPSVDGLCAYLGLGDGTFGDKRSVGTSRGPVSLLVADLNADGRSDLAVACRRGFTTSVLLARPVFGFQRIDFGTGGQPLCATAGDFNRDGFIDLAVAQDLGNTSLLLHRPDQPTAATISLAWLDANPTVVRLAWFRSPESSGQALVYRRQEATEWVLLGPASVEGSGLVRFDDSTVVAGGRYGYRVGIVGPGEEIFADEVWTVVPATLPLSIDRLVPNPVRGTPDVSFTLANSSPARIEILDVAGRRLGVQEVLAPKVGTREMRLDIAGHLSSGIYVVRLRQGNLSAVRKAIVLE